MIITIRLASLPSLYCEQMNKPSVSANSLSLRIGWIDKSMPKSHPETTYSQGERIESPPLADAKSSCKSCKFG